MKSLWMLGLFLLLRSAVANPFPPPSLPTPPDVTLTLAIANGRTTFHQGETIPLTLTFTTQRPNYYQVAMWNSIGVDRADLTPVEGAVWTDIDWNSFGVVVVSGAIPPPVDLGRTPVVVHTTANRWYRFEAPGDYTLRITSLRIEKPPVSAIQIFAGTMMTSNPIVFDILPDDPQWDRAQIAAIRQGLAANDPRKWSEAATALEDLGTHDAIDEDIALLKKVTPERPISVRSLFTARDRKYAASELTKAIGDPDFAVSSDIFSSLVRLNLVARHPLPSALSTSWKAFGTAGIAREKTIQREWPAETRRLADLMEAALPRKSGRTQAMSLVTLLAARAGDKNLSPDRSRHALQWARLYPGIAGAMTEEEQAEALHGPAWDLLKRAEIGRYLERLARRHARINDDYPLYDLREAALQRLVQIRPDVARRLILADIRSGDPELGFDTLAMLPDREVPSLDPLLKKNLAEDGPAATVYCLLISRYASRALVPAAIAAFNSRQGDPTGGEYLIAYLLRAAPNVGARIVDKEIRSHAGLLCTLADETPRAAVEPVILAHLHDNDPNAAADARQALERINSLPRPAGLQ